MTFTGERYQSPPGSTETEATLPPTPKFTTPDDSTDATAVRHVHVFDSSLSDPDA